MAARVHPDMARRRHFASHHHEPPPPSLPPKLRRSPRIVHAPNAPPLPGGQNPPTTWQHWLGPSSFFPNGVGHGLAPTIAMEHVAADYKSMAAYANARMGRLWHNVNKVKSVVH